MVSVIVLCALLFRELDFGEVDVFADVAGDFLFTASLSWRRVCRVASICAGLSGAASHFAFGVGHKSSDRP